MKKVFSSLLVVGIALPVPTMAQQVNYYQTCTAYREVYVPGYYDQYGYYQSGRVNTQSYSVPCGSNNYYSSSQQYRPVYRQRVCNPTAGALLGAGIAGAISGGSGWSNSGSSNHKYNKNGSSRSWKSTTTNNYSWQALGAGLGALAFSC